MRPKGRSCTVVWFMLWIVIISIGLLARSSDTVSEIDQIDIGQDCAGDSEPPTIAPGWWLAWQHTFENPLAFPPITEGSQFALIERADPIPNLYKDTVWMFSATSSAAQWRFDGGAALNLTEHWIELTAWSPKYFAAVLHDSHNPREFVLVFDRLTGKVVYQSELQALELAISDEALFYRSGERRLFRIDLPSGNQRWKDSRTDYLKQGLYPSGEWLYAFIGVISTQNSLNILKYNADSGVLVNSVEVAPVSEVLASDSKGIGRANGGYIALYDLSALTTVWQTNFEGQYPIRDDSNAFWDNPSRVTLTQDAVYLFDAQRNLVKIALSGGKVMWTVPFSDVEPMSKPAALAGVVYGFFSDGTIRAFSDGDGSQLAVVMKVPLWYWRREDAKPFRNLVGGVGVANDTLIITTGCRSVYAIQRAQ
jgi:hypothetical protein